MKHFDPIMRDRHPAVQLVIGQTQSGKSTYINLCLSLWARLGGLSLAIDSVSPPQPTPKHLAWWASTWSAEPPDEIPDEVSLVVCDESQRFISPGHTPYEAFREAIFRGQHRGRYKRSAILGAQRVIHVGVDALTQSQRIVCFRTRGEHDLQRLKRNLPDLTERHLEMLPRLPTGYAIVIDQRDGVWVPYVPEWHQQHRDERS